MTQGIEVTCKDLETGETQSMTIWNDVIVVTAGSAYIAGVEDYPAKGTQVYTIKGRNGLGGE